MMSAVFGDPAAFAAERDGISHALRRRAVSPPGRFLGDTNLEWWWEPLVLRRSIAGVLMHEEALPAGQSQERAAMPSTLVKEWPDARAWLFRNPRYAVTLSFARKPLATFTPFGCEASGHPYMTLPLAKGILPEGTTGAVLMGKFGPSRDIPVWKLGTKDADKCSWLVALPAAALWIGGDGFAPLGVENDTLTTPGRALADEDWTSTVAALSPRAKTKLGGNWLCIDGCLGLVASQPGFEYEPSGGFTQRSVAVDRVRPIDPVAWLMLPGAPADITRRTAAGFRVSRAAHGFEAIVPDPGGARLIPRDREAVRKGAGTSGRHQHRVG